jgi:PleD family two-component response regulator
MAPTPKTVILVADDEDAMVLMLRDALTGADYGVVVAHNGEEAIEQLRKSPPDLVLLDVKMPKMNGYDVCRQIKSDVFLRHIPVMLLTAQAGVNSKVNGLEQGADDYMTKPFDLAELIARIRTLLRRTRLGLEANPLTRLPGNVTIETEILARIQNKTTFAVLYIDLNSFKAYNDTYGFVKGDDVIRETARLILTQSALAQGFVGHIGGDDFVVLTAPDQSELLCQSLIKAFDAKVPGFYTPEDRARGYVETKDRRGQAARFPLLSMAIGVVTNQLRPIASLGEVSKIGAEMKHFAKENKGSAYAIDRRRE